MPKTPGYREVIDGRMVTIARRKDDQGFFMEVHIYPGPEMTGEPEHDLEYADFFKDHISELARLASREYPKGATA